MPSKKIASITTVTSFKLNQLVLLLLALVFGAASSRAEDFKFKLKNESKSSLLVFYKISKKSGAFKVKSLMKLKPDEERIKEVEVSKGDTISFYGQNQEDVTSALIKKDYTYLNAHKNQVFYIPIVIPEKENASFESLQNLSLQLEHNKVLNFLLKLDSSTVSSFSLLENNFQNVYPLGTFIFVDTKTNRLLLPPLEPSYWNNSENYLTIQDSLYALVTTQHQVQADAQIAYFLGRLSNSFNNNNCVELDFKGKLSLIRWRPSPNANIYQIFNDNAVKAFIQNCYAQIDNPDQQYQRYRLYFLTSYERVDNLEVYGRKFYNFGNQTDLSISSNPGFQLVSSNVGLMYAKNRTLSNYYSVQNAVLRTKAYDFTSLLFKGFKNDIKARIVTDTYMRQRQVQSAILGEYENLISYNPNSQGLSLAKLSKRDSSSLIPVLTTVANLTPYNYQALDTAKAAPAGKNDQVEAYNNRARMFNAHLSEINSLVKQLNQIDADITKISQTKTDAGYANTSKSTPGLLNEIEVSTTLVRKE
ncbi:hypothetical protein HH214_15170 [Mucilaginibacter robiniae]|uniref:Uncharacterized protein n=1 Tax=Mucilaginibacter robiniae TaxID=2728022 RepID=A0A7L5E170_9SPHI|nr:hypothetical protein [Mucilaginibacter robiniae]QJD97112.1 hypothetical protein HH214_15170 [Mucilaginibacter robiniae]